MSFVLLFIIHSNPMRLDDTSIDTKRSGKRSVRASLEEKLNIFREGHSVHNKKFVAQIDRVFEWSLYGLVFLMPLFFLPFTTDVLELNKQLLLFVGTLWLAILYTGKIIAAENIDFKWSSLHIGACAMLIAWLVSSIFSFYPYNSFWGLERQEFISFWTLVTLAIFAFITVNMLTKRIMTNASYALIISSAIAAIYTILQLFGFYIIPFGFTKTSGFNTVGLISLVGVLIAVTLVIATIHIVRLSLSKEKNKHILSVLLALFVAFSMIFLIILGEKQLWIGTIVGVGFALAMLYIKLPRDNKIMWLVLPSFVVVFSIAMLFLNLPRPITLPISIQPSFMTSASIALKSVADRPIFGSGPGNFLINYTKYRPQEINNINYLQAWSLQFGQSGSYMLTKVAETGALGIIGILVLFGLLAWTLGRLLFKEPISEDYVSLLGLSSALLAFGFFAAVKPGNMTIVFVFWLLISFAALYSASQMSVKMPKLQHTNRFVILSSVILCTIIIVGIAGTLVLVGRYGADQTFAKGIELDQKLSAQLRTSGDIPIEDIDKLLQTLVSAVNKDRQHHSYPRVLSQALIYKMNKTISLGDAKANEQVISQLAANAIETARRSVAINPHDVRNTQNLASAYQSIAPFAQGTETFVEDFYKQSIVLDPKNPLIHLEFAKYFIDRAALKKRQSELGENEAAKSAARGDYEKALSASENHLNEALGLKADYAPAHLRLALIAIERNSKSSAEELLDKSIMENIQLASIQSADETLFYLAGLGYSSVGNKEKALNAFRLALGLRPDYQLASWQAALIEAGNGNKDSVIKILESALSFDPDNEILNKRLNEVRSGKLLPETRAPSEQPELNIPLSNDNESADQESNIEETKPEQEENIEE